jgi:glycosyltransferase involved in cell wall biosynthesis
MESAEPVTRDAPPRFRVVVPTTGRETLCRAIDSAMAQSVQTEVVVVIDQLDRTESIRAAIGNRPVQVRTTKGGEGGGAARNRGAHDGEYDYVAFLDDDDWWDPHFLEQRYQVLRDAGSVMCEDPGFVAGRFALHSNRGGVSTIPHAAPPLGPDATVKSVASYLIARPKVRFGTNAMQTSGLLLSRSAIARVPWATQLRKHQDWDLLVRLVASGYRGAWDDGDVQVHVDQGSPQSISRTSRWRDSLAWLQSLPDVESRARADFLFVHVLRTALGSRSGTAMKAFASSRPGRPHLGALIVGFSGLVPSRRA